MADHSATLVGIADQLGVLPFGVVHRRLASAFSNVVFWIIGRHSTASRNMLGHMPTSPFHCRFDPFFQGSAHWNKRRG
uniref:Uncharacterized protein n=1 Tax=Solanum tuberosum TaxID=4113 RepID=M1D9I8_SOLTU